ncbi:hypothetical protein BJ912DRAFT_1068515 [Pholiota molesta]|nr:hypothetical protein BJ912DRAFT_1068515 [Pholiota molesta]
MRVDLRAARAHRGFVSGYRNRDLDDELMKMGHAELRAEGSDYDGQSRRASRSGSPTRSGASPPLASPGIIWLPSSPSLPIASRHPLLEGRSPA